MNASLMCLWLTLPSGQVPEMLAPPRATPVPVAPVVVPHPIHHADFARAFKPTPGSHEVLFVHPVTCCPVPVCFNLPAGCPRVCVGKRELVFDYGCCAVTIRFKLLCGKVRVIYS